ncbi:MAG: AEC family transporter [Oscillospiraceae bacterium]|nr:AEC family transporter [Oscillospiraceae bacterium]
MEQFLLMLQLQITLAIYVFVGVVLRKCGAMPKEASPLFTDFLLYVTLPFMIFSSYNIDQGQANTHLIPQLVLIGFACMFASLGISKVIYRSVLSGRRRVMQYGTIISNAGFIGIPVSGQIYGQLGLIYSSFFMIPIRVFIFTAGISLFVDSDIRTKVKNVLLHPATIAVLLGSARLFFDVAIPYPIDTAFRAIGECTVPLSMIIIGMILADLPAQKVVDRDVALLSFVRLIALPGALLILMKLAGADPVMTGVMVIHMAMPVGMTTAALAQKYGGDHIFALRCILFSTVLSLATAPLLILLI